MAYEFNGSNQSMQTTSIPLSSTPLTIACWFNSDSVTVVQNTITIRGTGAAYMTIFLRGDLAGDPIQVAIATTGAPSTASSTAGYSANTWNHACAVFSSSTSRSIYLNGANSATNTANASFTPNNILIGAAGSGAGTLQFMDGELADIGIWNAALTAAEIASLAKGMTYDKIRPQSLVFYAPLVRDLIDQKGGLAITNNNAATVAAHTRVYA